MKIKEISFPGAGAPEQQITEWRLSTVGKLFTAGVGAWMLGKATKLAIMGKQGQIDALARALQSSKRFQDELRKPGATVESVIQKLGLKNADAREFERVTGVPFPL